MKINVKTADDLNDQMRDFVNNIQRKVLVTLAKDTAKTIREESNGQLVAQQAVSPGKFVIGEPKTGKDPEGRKALAVERSTQAYKKAAVNASDKAYVASLINKAK